MEYRITWFYIQTREPVAQTGWADIYAGTNTCLAAARECCTLWAEGEPLEDARSLPVQLAESLTYLTWNTSLAPVDRSVGYLIERRPDTSSRAEPVAEWPEDL